MARITDCKTKKLLLEQETGQAYTKKNCKHYTQNNSKERLVLKKKEMGCITPIMDHNLRNE